MRRVQLVSNRDGERSQVSVCVSGTDPKCVESFYCRKCDNSTLVVLFLLLLFYSTTDSDVL